MKGIIYGDGIIVKNKKEAIEVAKRKLDWLLECDPDMAEPWMYVMKYNHPEEIWFTVGYVERENIANYIQLKKEVA